MNELAKRLEILIKESNKSVETISKDLKIDKSSLYRYLKNERTPSSSVIKDLSTYFNVTVDWILGNDDIKKEAVFLSDGVDELPAEYQKQLDDFKQFLLNKAKEEKTKSERR
jgi:transcriptional regulator with XRE-family HTH domain